MKETLKIEYVPTKHGQSNVIRVRNYSRIAALAHTCRMSIGQVADMLIDFVLERVELVPTPLYDMKVIDKEGGDEE